METNENMDLIYRYLNDCEFRSTVDNNQMAYVEGLVVINCKDYIVLKEDGENVTLSEEGIAKLLEITVETDNKKTSIDKSLLETYLKLVKFRKDNQQYKTASDIVCVKEDKVLYSRDNEHHNRQPKKNIVYEEEMYYRKMNLFSLMYEEPIWSKTFGEMVYDMLREKGMKVSDCYNNAGINRNILSKIKNNKEYIPIKSLCVSICFGLKLNVGESETLLKVAGYALGNNIFDNVCRCMLSINMHDVLTTNEQLEKYGAKLRLGSKEMV